jgi:hypothetical protein
MQRRRLHQSVILDKKTSKQREAIVELDLTQEILRSAQQHDIDLDSRQMQKIRDNCVKRLNQTLRSTIKSIVEEEVEDFIIDRDDAELV